MKLSVGFIYVKNTIPNNIFLFICVYVVKLI